MSSSSLLNLRSSASMLQAEKNKHARKWMRHSNSVTDIAFACVAKHILTRAIKRSESCNETVTQLDKHRGLVTNVQASRNMRFALKWGCKGATNGSSSVCRWQPSRMLDDLWPDLCLASQNTVLTDFPSLCLYQWFFPLAAALILMFSTPVSLCLRPGEGNSPRLWVNECVPELQFGLNCPAVDCVSKRADLRFVRCQARVTGHSQLSIPPTWGEKPGSGTYISRKTVLWLHLLFNRQHKETNPAFAAVYLVVLLPWERVRNY